MNEPLSRRRWLGRLTFVALCLFLIFLNLIPLETVPPSLGGITLDFATNADSLLASDEDLRNDPARWIAPDFLILVVLAWVARRPSFAPVAAIGAILLLADMLFQRPPGLWTALVLILSEILRGRSRSMRTLPFWLEWATVAGGLIVITIIYRFTLSMVLVTQAPLGLTLLQLIFTIGFYPVVVFLSYALFRVSRPAPGEVDELGHRL